MEFKSLSCFRQPNPFEEADTEQRPCQAGFPVKDLESIFKEESIISKTGEHEDSLDANLNQVNDV